jgi:hypothetical protein
MKTTAPEPFELFTTASANRSSSVSGAGDAAAGAATPTSGYVGFETLVEPDVLGRDATATLAYIVARRRHQDLEAADELRGLCHWADLHRVTPGHELAHGAIDPELLATDPTEHDAQIAQAKARLLGEPVPEWATTVLASSTPGELGTEGQLRLAGQGCFMIHEFAITHLATELGISEAAARAQVGQSLELRDRLPGLYRQVMTGKLPAWKGRQIAQRTIPLSAAAAAYVDAHLAPFAGRLSLTRIRKAVDAAILHHDPDRAAALAAQAAENRGVWVDHGPHGPADLPVATGTSRIEATLDTPDALAFDDAVAALAATLGELGHGGSLDVRRAKAVGVLADPQHALDLTATAATGPSGVGDGSAMRPKARTRKRLGGTVIHVHLHTAAIHAPGTGHQPGAGTGIGLGVGELSPVARIPQLGPRPTAAVQQWLADLAPGTQVTLTPVIDLAERISVDAHEAPPKLRAQVDALDAACVFPWCGREGRYDVDHIEEYLDPADGGPPGQTSSTNLGKLCRYHHRVKTHTAWRYRREPDRALTWTSPLGKQYRVDHTGTIRLPDLEPPGSNQT